VGDHRLQLPHDAGEAFGQTGWGDGVGHEQI
jgi:hypothetical protein